MQDQIFGISIEFYYSIVICVLVFYLLRYTPLGRRMLIVGQAREVARLSGISVSRVRIGSLLFSALLAGIAGILYAGYQRVCPARRRFGTAPTCYAAAFPRIHDPDPRSLQRLWIADRRVLPRPPASSDSSFWEPRITVQQIFYGAALLVAVLALNLDQARRDPTQPDRCPRLAERG